MFTKYIINHNEELHLYLVNYDIKKNFDNGLRPHVKSHFEYNTSVFH